MGSYLVGDESLYDANELEWQDNYVVLNTPVSLFFLNWFSDAEWGRGGGKNNFNLSSSLLNLLPHKQDGAELFFLSRLLFSSSNHFADKMSYINSYGIFTTMWVTQRLEIKVGKG